MSRRLSEMAEETMDTGSKSDRKMMQDVGFSEELKKQLEDRIAQSSFQAENQQAISVANLPVRHYIYITWKRTNLTYLQASAGQGTREQAAAQAWTGTENLHDAALRMLDDSHKRLRAPTRAPRIPPKINLRPAPKKNLSPADRLANARDKTSVYAFSQQEALTEEEREKFRKELKERFTPGARPMPTTLQGLTSLANERIEDAIARGQFKNIPRGKGKNIEKDYNANSPFLDTTEYFMNKIIQRQEIVPPWIEKQQELVKAVATFRGRLRNDWKRHAARSIASKGGSLQDQVRRAKAYALAEQKANPMQVKVERLSEITSDGNLSTVTVEERIAAGVAPDLIADPNVPATTITVTETSAEDAPIIQVKTIAAPPGQADASTPAISDAEATAPSTSASSIPLQVLPMAYPFRDESWARLESSYHTLAIAELNSLTRSYNLMAPKIAQKPYYNLVRELNRCYADVAPLLPAEIEYRSRRPTVKVEIRAHKEGGVMSKFTEGHQARVKDEDIKVKGYGLKEFWKDLWGKEEGQRARAS